MITFNDLKFMQLAHSISEKSEDSTKVGSVIVNSFNNEVISFGFNTFPVNVNKKIDERWNNPLKGRYIVHSEASAIINSKKDVSGYTMYITYYPCSTCAGLIVNSGIKKIICENKPDFNHERWGESWKIAQTIFEEAAVNVEYIN